MSIQGTRGKQYGPDEGLNLQKYFSVCSPVASDDGGTHLPPARPPMAMGIPSFSAFSIGIPA